MEEKVQKAFENLSYYTIKATKKVILEIDEAIKDERNEAVKEHLEQRKFELKNNLNTIINYLEE